MEPRCDTCEYAVMTGQTENTTSGNCHHPAMSPSILSFTTPRGRTPHWCPIKQDLEDKLYESDDPHQVLARQHWEYVKAVLEHAGETPENIEKIGFHYITAFEHGYKHGINSDAKTWP